MTLILGSGYRGCQFDRTYASATGLTDNPVKSCRYSISNPKGISPLAFCSMFGWLPMGPFDLPPGNGLLSQCPESIEDRKHRHTHQSPSGTTGRFYWVIGDINCDGNLQSTWSPALRRSFPRALVEILSDLPSCLASPKSLDAAWATI